MRVASSIFGVIAYNFLTSYQYSTKALVLSSSSGDDKSLK